MNPTCGKCSLQSLQLHSSPFHHRICFFKTCTSPEGFYFTRVTAATFFFQGAYSLDSKGHSPYLWKQRIVTMPQIVANIALCENILHLLTQFFMYSFIHSFIHSIIHVFESKKQNLQGRSLDSSIFSSYKLKISHKTTFRVRKTIVRLIDFREILTTLFVLNYWLTKFLLPAIASCLNWVVNQKQWMLLLAKSVLVHFNILARTVSSWDWEDRISPLKRFQVIAIRLFHLFIWKI